MSPCADDFVARSLARHRGLLKQLYRTFEDTRHALMVARYRGIHPYCITIDDEAMDYLPHMYGGAHFTVISEVEKLPMKVSDIYRRITC